MEPRSPCSMIRRGMDLRCSLSSRTHSTDVIFDEVNARFGALEGQYFSRLSVSVGCMSVVGVVFREDMLEVAGCT